MAKKTQDPKIRYDNAIKFLSEYYYQIPAEFDRELTAIFPLQSEVADYLVNSGRCTLEFEQGQQRFTLPCHTRTIDAQEEKYQATYWHNYLFNRNIPGVVKIVGFQPIWESGVSG